MYVSLWLSGASGMVQNLIWGVLALAIPWAFHKLDWSIALVVWAILCAGDLVIRARRGTLLRDQSRAVFMFLTFLISLYIILFL